ncbi:MAG: hypothetical protein R2873_24010 [Caldilineaceae bacterium]
MTKCAWMLSPNDWPHAIEPLKAQAEVILNPARGNHVRASSMTPPTWPIQQPSPR